MRTTIDLDPSVLRALKKRQREENKTLGQLVSELLAPALREPAEPARDLYWASTSGTLLVDLEDKDALYEVLDAHE